MKCAKTTKALVVATALALVAILANVSLAVAASGGVATTGSLRVTYVDHDTASPGVLSAGVHTGDDAPRTRMNVALETRDGTVALEVDDARQDELVALANRQVEVLGTRAGDDAIAVTSLAAVDPGPAAQSSPLPEEPARVESPGTEAAGVGTAPRPMRIAVVVFDSNSASSASDTSDRYFGADAWSVKNAFDRASRGQVAVSGRVFGPYTSGIADGDCSFGNWVDAGAAAAARDGYLVANFDHIVVHAFGRSCGFAGEAEVTGRRVFIPRGVPSVGVMVHELGHNLGARHAGLINCTRKFSPTCPISEYGDPFDVMGQGFQDYFQAVERLRFGWIPTSAAAIVESGTQTIDLIEQDAPPSTPGTRIALLYLPKPVYYYDQQAFLVERRTFGGTITGQAWLRYFCTQRQVCPNAGGSNTHFVDATPQDPADRGALVVGTPFVDPTTGARIELLPDPARGVTRVRLCVNNCGMPPRPPGVYVYKDKSTIVVEGTDAADVVNVRSEKGVRVLDANGAAINPGPGCSASGGVVSCKGGALDLRLGAGDDRATVSSRIPSRFDGGLGNDTFVGSRAADVFVGGAGTDTVDYRGRNIDKKAGGPVVYTIGGGKVSGQKGERDDIGADIERVLTP